MPLVVILLSNAINNVAITVGKINTWNKNSRVIVLRIHNKHNTTNLMALIANMIQDFQFKAVATSIISDI